MIYHPRTPQEAVNLRKEHADTAVYLAGGTDDLRLGGAAEGKDLIDITGFDFNTITEKDGKVYIGALCTLQDVIESELVPAFIREAAGFCASFAKRSSATVGGNLGLRRSDSYLAAALTAADATLKSITPHGEQDKPVGEYLQSDCKRLIEYVVVDKDRTGSVKRFFEYFTNRRACRNIIGLGRDPCHIVWQIRILTQVYRRFRLLCTDQAELYCNLTVFGWSRCCGLFPDCIKRLRKLCGNLCVLLGTCIVFAEPALKGIAAL